MNSFYTLGHFHPYYRLKVGRFAVGYAIAPNYGTGWIAIWRGYRGLYARIWRFCVGWRLADKYPSSRQYFVFPQIQKRLSKNRRHEHNA